MRSRPRFLLSLAWLLGLGLLPCWNALAAEVWSGPEIVFARPSKSDPVPTECSDPVSDSVRISRASLQGLFNSVLEAGYGPQSPADTEWAWDLAGFNLGLEISAANFAALEFNAWRAAHGGNPRNALGLPGVVHLISEDVYLDIEFLDWGGAASGGAFAYRRTTPGGARVCGDMDLDSDVDADDVFRLRTHLAAPEGFDGSRTRACRGRLPRNRSRECL